MAINNVGNIATWMQNADRALEMGDYKSAGRYYQMVLDRDSTNWRAQFYVVYCNAASCRIADIVKNIHILWQTQSLIPALIGEQYDKQYINQNQLFSAVLEYYVRSEEILTLLCKNLKSFASQHNDQKMLESYFACTATTRLLLRKLSKQWIDLLPGFANNQRVVNTIAASYKRLNQWLLDDRENSGYFRFYYMPDIQKGLQDDIRMYDVYGMSSFIKKVEPNYVSPLILRIQEAEKKAEQYRKQDEEAKRRQNGCYIATSVYGSYDCPQVWTLRRYRDECLAKSFLGRAFVRIYYWISPRLVAYFGGACWFRAFWKRTLDAMVLRLNDKGVSDKPYQDCPF